MRQSRRFGLGKSTQYNWKKYEIATAYYWQVYSVNVLYIWYRYNIVETTTPKYVYFYVWYWQGCNKPTGTLYEVTGYDDGRVEQGSKVNVENVSSIDSGFNTWYHTIYATGSITKNTLPIQGTAYAHRSRDGYEYTAASYTMEVAPEKTTKRKGSTLIDSVKDTNPDAYVNGASGSYWYEKQSSTEKSEGDTYFGYVSSPNRSAYSDRGVSTVEGNERWTRYATSEQSAGTQVGTVTSYDVGEYPSDGIKDGYWYKLITT